MFGREPMRRRTSSLRIDPEGGKSGRGLVTGSLCSPRLMPTKISTGSLFVTEAIWSSVASAFLVQSPPQRTANGSGKLAANKFLVRMIPLQHPDLLSWRFNIVNWPGGIERLVFFRSPRSRADVRFVLLTSNRFLHGESSIHEAEG